MKKYTGKIGSFNSEEFKSLISKIKTPLKKTQEKEKWFKEIALVLLKKNGFPKIIDGKEVTKRHGVPFDLAEKRNNTLSLIELKGSKDTFNYSKKVQYARLYHILHELKHKKRNITTQIYLFQINLEYDLFQILEYDFYSIIFPQIDMKNVGWDLNNISAIVNDILDWMAKAK